MPLATELPPPPLTERTALLCAILFTFAYIAPFYISTTLRSTPLQSRDSPTVINARIRAVVLSCIFSTAFAVYILVFFGRASAWDTLRLMAMWPIDPLDIVKVFVLVVALFVGPLYETFVVEGEWRTLTPSGLTEALWTDLRGFRNLVVAPISEELVFRSLTISLYLLASADPLRTIVLQTPLIFGLAHIHHLAEYLQTFTPSDRKFPPLRILLMGLLRSAFQFTYTSLFGIFAAFVFVRTGNVFAAMVAHSFCNAMGVPRLSGRIGRRASVPMARHMTADVAQGKKQDEVFEKLSSREQDAGDEAPLQKLCIAWSVAYYALLAVGAFVFYKLLWVMTESKNALARL